MNTLYNASGGSLNAGREVGTVTEADIKQGFVKIDTPKQDSWEKYQSERNDVDNFNAGTGFLGRETC